VKNILIYVVIFGLAFAGTSIGVYIFNNKYANMFELDFRNRAVVEAAFADSLAALAADSLAHSDSLQVVDYSLEKKTKELKENLHSAKGQLTKIENELDLKDSEIERLKQQLDEKQKTDHEEWLKSTIKLYEAMDAIKAGELLGALPDNEAREILYSMKNKKAAEILSSLDVNTVKRLTRAIK
jgi:flagellar motility protein MotE (MotC chaperone)